MLDYYEEVELEEGEVRELPVLLDEVKEWCKVDSPVDNPLMLALIKAATDRLEAYCNRIFIERSIVGYYAGADFSRFEKFPFLTIRRSPLIEVESVEYLSDAEFKELDADAYEVRKTHAFSRLMIKQPVITDSDSVYTLTVTFAAGYGDRTQVPEDIKTAIKMLVAFWYENRGDTQPDGGMKIPDQVKTIIASRRILDTCV
jgi:uncharacterized phiE125 gp8 family phage protein